MKRTFKSARIVAAVVAISALIATSSLSWAAQPPASGAALDASPFEIAGVVAPDSKSIEVTFSKPLDAGLQQYIAANTNAVRPFIRISGGTSGMTDQALDGATMQAVNAAVFVADIAEGRIRIVLPTNVTLTPTGSYSLWLDGAGTSLTDLRFRAADGTGIEVTETDPIGFDGTATSASLATIASVEALTSRSLRLTFAQPILSGMANHTYTTNPSRITVVGADAGVRPVYVEPVPATDRRTYDIFLNGDLAAGEAYALQVLGNPTSTSNNSALRTTAGTAPASTPIAGNSGFIGSSAAHELRIDDVTVNDDRNQLTVRFNTKIRDLAALPHWSPGSSTSRPVIESPVTGTTGDVITAADIGAILSLSGRLEHGPAGPATDLAGALRRSAAFFADRQTIVISLAEGQHFRRGLGGELRLLPNSLVDVTGTSNGDVAQTVSFVSPDAKLPPRPGSYDPKAKDYLTVDPDQTVTFTHYDYSFVGGTNPPNYRVDSNGVSDRVVDEQVNAIVVENKYIKATFTPEYGARMISMVYKPTGNDLLYQNPVGTPYGHGNNSPFYANWLMVWGGVAPTFSEPEHGKYWFLPWEYELTESADQVSIHMWKVDTINHRLDSRFRYGATNLRIDVTYTVYKSRPIVDFDVSIHNPGDVEEEFEYWTLTTMAPGEQDPHDASPTMEFIVPADVIRRDSSYTWMGAVEQQVNPGAPGAAGRDLYLRNMRFLSRWSNNGIAYSRLDEDGGWWGENPQGGWWGVINHENEEGVIRVAPNDVTRGMKFWAWGYNASFDTNPYTKGNSARPYMEPWGGTPEAFFIADTLAPGETKAWTETFLPIVDLHDVTNANRNGAARVEIDAAGSASAYVYPTIVGSRVLQAFLTNPDTGQVIAHRTFKGDPYESIKLAGPAGGATSVRLTLTLEETGEVLLVAERSMD